MFVGLTGQIGAGKSSAARILESFGAKVIDADQIGRRVVDESAALRRKLALAFGADVILPNGRLDRQKVAARAFVDDHSRSILNGIVHPLLLKELGREMKLYRRQYPVVVIDAALLLDWGLDRQMDLVLAIDAPEDVRFARLAARGLSRDDAMARQKIQMPHAEFLARADRVIVNDGTEDDLRRELARLWAEIMSDKGVSPHEQPHPGD